MKIFVTGGSGFVGGHLIEKLAGAGHDVRALARSAASAKAVKGYGATPVDGDLATLEAKHIADAEVIVHAAAWVKSWGKRSDFVEGNVEGTRRVLDAAKKAGAKRFIHISTEAMLFNGADLRDIDETFATPSKQRYLYSETKAEAERIALAANSPGFTVLALRPRLVWGPRDASVLPEVLEAVKKGAFAWLDRGEQDTSTCWVGNLASAVELALTRGEGAQAYFIADDGTRKMREFLTALAQTQGVTLPARSIPGGVARPLASLVEGTWSLFAPKSKPPMVAFSIHMLSRSVTVKTDKARRELGYVPAVSVEQGLAALSSARAQA
ncbi:MAG: NAD-dependent epimerase/dehydratase family protein [Archangium sp.]|nr:NAD-dependent epimerase/dehydratase family protein [Archangium sp.]